MSTDIDRFNDRVPAQPRSHVIQPTTFAEVITMAEFLSRSGMVPAALRGKPADIAAILLKGSEMGVYPMTALAQIIVIQGKPCCSPELMRALAARAGHRITFEHVSATTVTVLGTRGDNGETLRITWDIDRAIKAKLGTKDTWLTFPQAMLVARATSELVRYLFPDLGIGYIPEELGANVNESGEVIDVPSPVTSVVDRGIPVVDGHLLAVEAFVADIKDAGLGAELRAWGLPLGFTSWAPAAVSVNQLAAAVEWVNNSGPTEPDPDPVEDVPLIGALMTAVPAEPVCKNCAAVIQEDGGCECPF